MIGIVYKGEIDSLCAVAPDLSVGLSGTFLLGGLLYLLAFIHQDKRQLMPISRASFDSRRENPPTIKCDSNYYVHTPGIELGPLMMY
jgi:hypothetical protein